MRSTVLVRILHPTNSNSKYSYSRSRSRSRVIRIIVQFHHSDDAMRIIRMYTYIAYREIGYVIRTYGRA